MMRLGHRNDHATRGLLAIAAALAVGLCGAPLALAQQQSAVVSKDAGPIWNNNDANNKCPKVCAPAKWNNQWRTTVPNKMSVCDCEALAPPPPTAVVSKDAGPIWNNNDANNKCPKVCAPAKWNNQWRTTVPNKMSVCDCETLAPPPPTAVVSKDAGPIWNNNDANNKCPKVCAPAKWNNQWRTTVPNKMSVCDCETLAPPPPAAVVSKDAGPIWNNNDANNKCRKVCAPGKWNNQWRTTVPNKMSVCDCEP